MWNGFARIASLRFQPTKRPQITAQKAKAKAIAARLGQPPPQSTAGTTPPPPPPPEAPKEELTAPKTSIEQWKATISEDEEATFFAGKRQRGGRKKRKKNKDTVEVTQDWDDIYDPTRPNNYEEYKHSEEKIREVREWKDLLYRHRMKRKPSSDYDSDRSERPLNSKYSAILRWQCLIRPGQFAPPSSFAPPPTLDEEPPPPPPDDASGDDAYARRMLLAQSAPPVEIANDPSGEDAYARRARLSQNPTPGLDLPPPPPSPQPAPAPPGQISRAPVRYSFPAAPAEIPVSEAELETRLAEERAQTDDQPRSNRPGQAGFAERLMAKYGWSQGQGLGAQSTGITTALYAKVDKRKKKSDAEGGGFATPAATGKILGGKRTNPSDEEGKFGAMSEVIRLSGMLKGMDLEEELTRGEGGIMQEIGEECGDKYGSVQRVYIQRDARDQQGEESPAVFVHFVSQLSALRAVNALEGRVFNGNVISARFWDREQFEKGQYD